MPSAFTHALAGAAVAQLLPTEAPRRRLAVAFAVAATVPDLDVVTFLLDIPYIHPLGHRGWTHSLLFAALFGSLAVLLVPASDRRGIRQWGPVALCGVLAVASHGVLDAFTDAGRGVGFLIPFDNDRYFAPSRPIEVSSVDPRRFFSARGIEILASEIRWVWTPLALFSLLRWAEARQRADPET